MKQFILPIILAVLLMMPVVSRAQVPWLHVEGNQIKDESGNPVTLRGVSVIAPEHNNECTTCNRKPVSELITWQVDAAAGWHSRILRLQVTTAKVSDPAESFATMIDPYVQEAIAKGLYVIVDLHHVANFDYNGSGGVTQEQVLAFWNYVAPKYANTPNVIFEVFNEPISPDCWSCWKEFIQPVVQSIRAVAPNLILIGNPQWSTRVNQAAADPIAGSDLVYVYHIYPNQGTASETNLNSKFGNAAQTIPVMITEFGWNQHTNYSDGVTRGTTSGWGVPFRQYIDARPHISWTGYIFDNFWKPQYFDWNWNLMGGENQGQFLQQWLLEMKDENQPEVNALTAYGVTSRQVNLAWPSDPQALSYNVKRSSQQGGPYTTIASGLGGLTYSDTTLSAATTYYYVVSSNTSTSESANSVEASATTIGPGFAPDVPLYLTATGGDGQIALSWRASTGALSYLVKRSESRGGPYNVIGTVSTTSYVDSTITNGSEYYYVVSAVNSNQESVNSSPASDIASSEVIIVDNVTAVQTGGWTASSGSPGYYGANYLHDANTGAAGGKFVTYSPNVPVTGSYHISLWWTSASNRASNVAAEVHHAGGIATFTLNQQHHGGLWMPLGVFLLNANAKVVIKNDGANGYVIADAVKFARSTGHANLNPTAVFHYVADGLTVNFDASGSWDGDGTIASYHWDFGDSTASTGVSPSHTYSAAGDYLVTLTVADDSSATHAVQQTITVTQPVNKLPVASFTYAAHILNVSFDASASTDEDGSIINYHWNFGDSTTATGVLVNHQYAASGSYTVTLTVEDDSTATVSLQQIVSVSNDITEITTVTVNQQQNGNIMNVLGTYTFAAGTSGSVRIRTNGTNGYVVADAIRFSKSGQSDIIVDNSDPGVVIDGNWISTSFSPGYVGSDYLHDDNTGKGNKTVTFTPNLPVAGEWTVLMQWTAHTNRATNVPVDIIHLMDTSTNQPPLALFDYEANGLTISFDASASTDHGTITDYRWYFGDGTTGSGQTIAHTYAEEGNYTVTLTVTDDSTATSTYQQVVTVLDMDGISTFLVNQQQNGGVMNVLGTFPFDTGSNGSVRIRTDNTNGYVVADAVKFSMEGQSDIILDNTASSGVIIEGDWLVSAVNSGYVGANYAHDNNTGKGTKRITYVPNLPVAGNWTVSIQWPAYINRATNVPVDVLYATTSNLRMATAQGVKGDGTMEAQENTFSIYPNPATHGGVTVGYASPGENTFLRVLHVSGKEMFRMKMNTTTAHINTDKFSPGVYLLVIESNGYKQKTARILVK